MIEFNAATALMAVMGLMQALFCVAWVIVGARLKLARSSAFLWAAFSLCVALAASLFVHPASHFSEPIVLFRGVAIVMAALLLRWGIDAFLDRPRHRVESALIVSLYIGAVLFVGLDRESQSTRAVLQSAAICWVLLRSIHSRVKPLREEFGLPTALVLSAVLASIGLGFGGFGLATGLGALSSPVDQPTAPNVGFLAVMVLASASFNFLLGFMVVARVVRELQWQTRHDALTGLFNRRAFHQELEREQQLSARRQSPMAVLMIDVDHFKRINDSLGHAAGDAVLAAIAQVLEGASRRTDVIARVGGEEFALLLPDTDAHGAEQQGERLRLAVDALRLPDQVQLHVTVSVGVGEWMPGAIDAESPLQLADRALYRAKANGRNRVEVLVSASPVS